ncbi:MAG: GDP-mannose 4,6-dehydratase, partial [Fibrobacteria bacterium]|nr:GDP-mannose 4,6-dehydratase [Fibrobacteria bacterium]
YNIGGGHECTNFEIANTICDILDEMRPALTSYKDQINFVTDRLGHDRRYAVDSSKITKHLGWEPRENFQTGIKKTLKWYLKRYKSSNFGCEKNKFPVLLSLLDGAIIKRRK